MRGDFQRVINAFHLKQTKLFWSVVNHWDTKNQTQYVRRFASTSVKLELGANNNSQPRIVEQSLRVSAAGKAMLELHSFIS